MQKYKQSRVELLKVLCKIVNEEMDYASINKDIEEDVSNFLTDITDKRRIRYLKSVRKELEKWIKEELDAATINNKTLKESDEPKNLHD